MAIYVHFNACCSRCEAAKQSSVSKIVGSKTIQGFIWLVAVSVRLISSPNKRKNISFRSNDSSKMVGRYLLRYE